VFATDIKISYKWSNIIILFCYTLQLISLYKGVEQTTHILDKVATMTYNKYVHHYDDNYLWHSYMLDGYACY
jgi:hypothetical protein